MIGTPTDRPQPADPARPRRRLILTGAAAVAIISTLAAYVAMVGFGRDILAMNRGSAYAFAGVFELSLVTVALMAREAAQQDRDTHTLLTLTWMLSAASGTFSAWHELEEGHPIPAAGFRLTVPLLAALMWHLALIGDRHLAARRPWTDLLAARRMHALFLATEAWHRTRLEHDQTNTRRTSRRLAAANARRLRARSIALRTIDPADMDREVTAWVAALDAVNRGTDHITRPTGYRPGSPDIRPDRPDRRPDSSADKPDNEALTDPNKVVHALTSSVTQVTPAGTAAVTPVSDTSTDPAVQAATLRASGLSVPEVADRLGVSERSVYRWTNREIRPHRHTDGLAAEVGA